MKQGLRPLAWAMLIIFWGVGALHAQTSVDKLFTSHMVLQREMPVPIWGKGKPRSTITVSFQKQKKITKVQADGTWRLKLNPLKLGKPGTLKIKGPEAIVITLTDVLVGDVWLGSGQSNMATHPSRYTSDKKLFELIKDPPPDLRIYNGTWGTVSSENISKFSALLYSFGVPLQQKLKIPIGLFCSARGSSESALWLTQEMIDADPTIQKIVSGLRDKSSKMKATEKKARWQKVVATLGGFYKRGIEPFAGFAIRGVLWDQGESGVGLPGVSQVKVMELLINGWRKAWEQDFPWVCVQKPSGGGCAWDYTNPMTSNAKIFSELPKSNLKPRLNPDLYDYVKIGNISDTAIVPTSDLVSGVHPPTKSSYGQRAADVALAFVYKDGTEYNGPTYQSHKKMGNKIVVTFTHVGKGLAFKNGKKLQGFEISNDGKDWQWANGTVENNMVVLSSKKMKAPKHVRYAWSRNHPWANLFNKNGLPAFSFSSMD
jgi:sialate O-acetylesterase